ncbi:MAG: tetratricopeptide repeat protein [Caldicoprobacterales bacterium]|jgi:tetratricopeptide (TPR) repeat protein|nr:tetratricopeptide repeat protein [Clostridiales bacterium]
MGLIGNIYGFLGYFNHSKGKNEKALDWYQKAEKNNVTSPNYQMAYGVLLMRTGHYEKARQIFDRLLVFFPHNASIRTNARFNLALVYWKIGDLETAVERMTKMHSELKNSRTYGALGYLLIENGDLDKALKFNLDALEYDDTDPVVLDNLGQTYYQLGDLDQAFSYFQKAIEQKEDLVDALYHLGNIYIKREQLDEAKEVLEKALECKISDLNTVTREDIEAKLKEIG